MGIEGDKIVRALIVAMGARNILVPRLFVRYFVVAGGSVIWW